MVKEGNYDSPNNENKGAEVNGDFEKMASEYADQMNKQRADTLGKNAKIDSANIKSYLEGNLAKLKEYINKYGATLGGHFFEICAAELDFSTRANRSDKHNDSEWLTADMVEKQSILLKAQLNDNSLMLADSLGKIRKMALDYKINGGDPRNLLKIIISKGLKRIFETADKPIPEALRFIEKKKVHSPEDIDLDGKVTRLIEFMKQNRINQLVREGTHPRLAKKITQEEGRVKPYTEEELERIKEVAVMRERHHEKIKAELGGFLNELDIIIEKILNQGELNRLGNPG